ncbi:MAG TPA: hypothetical protein VI818_08740, partial [Candidatus Thermoplasmatota archaeon]|nr:hypothetical protein [Candidatus Thermoplasmatota archaeon]
SCDFYGDPVPRSVDQGAIVLSISKIKLTQVGQEGQRVRNANLPGRLVAGDALVDVYARTTYRPVFLGTGAQAIPQVTDRAPDTGLLQVPLRYGSPAPDLRMKLGQSAVIGGQENQVPVEVQNLGTHKRIVNLSVELKPLVGPPPWSASITPSVTLGAGKSTNVTLRVNPPAADAKERSVAAIKLRATILTEPGTIAIATGYLVSVSALDRDHSTFYAWGAHQSWITVGTSVPFLGNGYGGLTRSENDDRFPGSPFEMYQRFGSSGGLTSWAFESPLVAEPIPNPALFRKGEPMKGVVEIEMPFPSAATLTVLAEFGPQLLVQQDRPISVVQGRNRFEVQAPMLPTANRLEPSNGTMKVTVRITVNGPEAGLYWTSFFGTNVPRLVPKTTHFNFPLDREYPAVESASKAKVFLTPAEELDAFLNPGNVQVFELDLRNEEPRPMQLALEALNVTEGWNVEIRPGARFRLAKEDSVRVGVLVRAPQTSMEGDVLRFRVVVREVANDTLVAGQWIRAIVTRGVDIENETFEPAQDDAKKLDAPTAKSPATPLVAALLALGAMAELRRRRRN